MSEWFYKRISWFAGYLAIAVLFGLIVFAANIEIKDIDLWLHLAVGKHILQTLSIPKVDFLSCTIVNKPWINHEWLFQTLVYSVYNNGGIEGLIDLKAAMVFLTFVILLFIGYSRERQFTPVFVLFLVLLTYQFRLTLRPDIFSLFFFALYIWILGMNLDKRWSLWVIVVIQILWTNMHGYFIFGPILALINILAEWTKRKVTLPFEWNHIGRLSDEEFKRLKGMFLLVVLSCLVNPYFIKGALYPISILFSAHGKLKVFFSQIQELQRPLTWNNILFWQKYFYYKLLIVVSFVSFIINRRKIDINAFLIWLIFLLFSLVAVRNIVFFAFSAYFAFLANVQYISIDEFLPSRWKSSKVQAIFSMILKAILIIWMINYGNSLMFRGYYDFDKFERKSEFGGLSQRNFAHQAVDFLVKNKITGNFFNDFNSGSYLLGGTSPNIKVFIDGRTEVYGAEFFQKYKKIWKGDVALFEEAADRYRLTGAFLNSVYVPVPEKFIEYLYKNKDWVLVYFDYDAAIFLKDIPENQKWINRYRINLTQRETPTAPLLKIGTYKVIPYRYVNRAYALYNMGFPGKAKNEAIEALRIQPYNAQAHKLLGKIYNERGEYAKGFESLRKAKLLEPDDMRIRYGIALALYHLGELTKAKEQCQRVLSGNPKDSEAQDLMLLIREAEK